MFGTENNKNIFYTICVCFSLVLTPFFTSAAVAADPSEKSQRIDNRIERLAERFAEIQQRLIAESSNTANKRQDRRLVRLNRRLERLQQRIEKWQQRQAKLLAQEDPVSVDPQQLIEAAKSRLAATSYVLDGRCQSNAAARYVVVCFNSNRSQIVRLSHQKLLDIGVDLTGVPKEMIGAMSLGQEVPVFVSSNTLFDENSYVEILADGIDTIYSAERYYQLFVDFDNPPANSVADVAGSSDATNAVDDYTAELNSDINTAYSVSALSDQGWYNPNGYRFLSGNQSAEMQFEFSLDAAALIDRPASLEYKFAKDAFYLQSVAVEVLINGWSLGAAKTDEPGTNSTALTAEVPANILQAGTNVLTIKVANKGFRQTRFEFDEFTLQYSRQLVAVNGELAFSGSADVYRITGVDSSSVVAYRQTAQNGAERLSIQSDNADILIQGSVADADYLVASVNTDVTLIKPRAFAELGAAQAQYLIISHPDFIDSTAMTDFIAWRQTDYSVHVVDVDQIFAQYASGSFSPDAIKAFIGDMVENAGTDTVLLVGDDTYDYRDRLAKGEQSWMPSLYVQKPKVMPSDAQYVDFDGDTAPDIAIGRMPVSSAEELRNIIDKTIAYDNHYYPNTLLAATNYTDGLGPSHYHPAISNGFRQAGWRVYDALVAVDDASAVESARQLLVNIVNQGTSLLVYTGHNAGAGGALFNTGHLSSLSNSGRPTILVSIDSFTGYYLSDQTSEDTGVHAENFITSQGIGGAAAFAPASLVNFSTVQNTFLQQLRNNQTLGQAYLAAMRFAVATTGLSYNLFGDPALRLKVL